jgi:hypothetical protein
MAMEARGSDAASQAKGKTIMLRKSIVILALWLASGSVIAESALVVAVPKHVTFVMAEGDLPQNRGDSSHVFVGGVYSTILQIREVLHGSVLQKNVEVRLVATSRENLTKAGAIVVILSKDASGKLQAVGWGELRTLACVAVNDAEDAGLTSTLPLLLPGVRCAPVARNKNAQLDGNAHAPEYDRLSNVAATGSAEPPDVTITYDKGTDLCSVSGSNAHGPVPMSCDKLRDYVRTHYPPGQVRP